MEQKVNYAVGDVVRYSDHFLKKINPYRYDLSGDIGVVAVAEDGSIGIRWDTKRGIYHTLDGVCEHGHGLWVGEDWITHYVPDEPDVAFEDTEWEEFFR